MRFHPKQQGWGWCFKFAGVLVAAALAAHEARAKGPPATEPEPDFVIETVAQEPTWGDYFIVGAVVDSGIYNQKNWITDENGVKWIRHRFFRRGFEETNYFEAILPAAPERRVEYVVVLTAGPDGYSDGENLYFGDWAIAIVTGRIVNLSMRIPTNWYNTKFKTAHFRVPEFTLNGFLAP
jgi:hypothetical protein